MTPSIMKLKTSEEALEENEQIYISTITTRINGFLSLTNLTILDIFAIVKGEKTQIELKFTRRFRRDMVT